MHFKEFKLYEFYKTVCDLNIIHTMDETLKNINMISCVLCKLDMIFCLQDMELQLEQAKSELQLQSSLASGLQDSQVCLFCFMCFLWWQCIILYLQLLNQSNKRTDKFVVGVYTVMYKSQKSCLYTVWHFEILEP